MSIVPILAPILLLILLGVVLARIRFLGVNFMADLNKLTFWIALPALLFRSVAHAEKAGSQTLQIIALLLVVAMFAAIVGWLASIFLKLPGTSHGTLAQSSFRGNLAYIGIPLLSYAFVGLPNSREAFATSVIVMTILTAFYNLLAVIVLQASRHQISWSAVRIALKSIFSNPLIVAGIAGLPLGLTQTPMPLFLDRTLEALGGAAVPIALLCIGGSLAHAQFGNRLSGIIAAGLIKTAIVPVIVWYLAPVFHLQHTELRIALIFAACPTAAAAYVMAQQMDGDESLASGSIVLSTILSAASLSIALLVSS